MKKRLLIVVLPVLLCLLQSGFAQPAIKQFVKEHAQRIVAIDPDSINYTDLEAIGNAIGNARVVMLGEQDHGDAPAFLAKTRIIKYLHEQKGFDVLAFESDFFMNYGWEQIKKEHGNVDSFLRQYIYPIWTYCDACVPLFKYIPATQQTARPLELAGFDNQMGSVALFPQLDAALKRLQAPITVQQNYSTDIYPLISTWYNYTKDSVTLEKCIQYIKEIKQQLGSGSESNGFWPMITDNQLAFIEQMRRFRVKNEYWKHMNVRDSQMAVNLKWLSEVKYAGKKIIVWAHNYHISKYGGHYPQSFLNEAKTMGTCYTSDTAMRDQTYILGFTSYQGTEGRLTTKPVKIPAPKKNSLESWMNKDYNFAFLNFRDYNTLNSHKQESFYMSGAIIGGADHRNEMAEWTNVYDGVFYIKNMYPCKAIK
jgi:erythromycin esterase-like protein